MQIKAILHSLQQGILICDKSAKILYFNQEYGRFIGKTLEETIGHSIASYRKGSKIPDVMKTGIPIEGVLRKEKNQEYFASIYPIIEDGKVVGSISTVTTIAQSKLQIEKTSKTLSERVSEFEKNEIEKYMAVYGKDLKGKKKVAKELGISLATLYSKLSKK